MAKLLSESTVRRFQKLANVKVLREQEEPEMEMPEDEQMEPPEDPMAGAEMAEDEIPEAARETLAQELVQKIAEVLDVDIDIDVEESEGANDLPDETDMPELPAGGEGDEGMEGEDEELAELQEWLLKEGYGLDEEDDYMMEELYEEEDLMDDEYMDEDFYEEDLMEELYEEDDMMGDFEGNFDMMEELYEEDDVMEGEYMDEAMHEEMDLDLDDLDDEEMMMESKIRRLKKQLAERKRLNKRASVITERVWKRLKRGR